LDLRCFGEPREGKRATATKVEGWRLIEDATADIRRSMTQKHGIEF
jgi:hypothetical protein